MAPPRTWWVRKKGVLSSSTDKFNPARTCMILITLITLCPDSSWAWWMQIVMALLLLSDFERTWRCVAHKHTNRIQLSWPEWEWILWCSSPYTSSFIQVNCDAQVCGLVASVTLWYILFQCINHAASIFKILLTAKSEQWDPELCKKCSGGKILSGAKLCPVQGNVVHLWLQHQCGSLLNRWILLVPARARNASKGSS